MFKKNLPDYQSTIQFNRASLSLALKMRIGNIVLITMVSIYFIVIFSLTTDLNILWIANILWIIFIHIWLCYHLIKGYTQWHNILKTGTKIEKL